MTIKELIRSWTRRSDAQDAGIGGDASIETSPEELSDAYLENFQRRVDAELAAGSAEFTSVSRASW